MKKYFLSTFIILTLSIKVFSNVPSIISIEDYIATHQDESEEIIASYLAKRCAATFTVVTRILNEGDIEDQRIIESMQTYASEVEDIATRIDAALSGRDYGEVQEEVSQEVDEILNVLWSISEEHYSRTGVYLEPHAQDLKRCQFSFRKQMQNN